MIRSDIPRTEFRRAPVAESKKRTRKCAVAACRKPFEPRNSMVKVCSPTCAHDYAVAERVRKERSERQEGLRKLKRRADHVAEAQAAVNAYVRARDEGMLCISCGRENVSSWHAGHYLSVGAHPNLRFDERNIHRQCKRCNVDLHGNQARYRIGLLVRITPLAVEALEADQTPRKWTIEELQAIKATYRLKLKQLKETAPC